MNELAGHTYFLCARHCARTGRGEDIWRIMTGFPVHCPIAVFVMMTIKHTNLHLFCYSTSFPGEAIRSAIKKATKELGYKELQHKQEQAVKSFLSGNDIRYCSGKSLSYCLLPKAFDLLCQTSAQHAISKAARFCLIL